MNTNNYLPFDLETALKHPERVVTRDGRKVEQLHFFKRDTETKHPIYGILDGNVEHWNNGGNFCIGTKSDYDLFLLPEVKECWVNVYLNSKDDIERWYLIQSIMGDTSDGWNFVQGMGKVKAEKFVDNLLAGNKTFNDYVDLFPTPAICLLANQVCRMNQVDKDMKLKLCSIEDVIYGITGF